MTGANAPQRSPSLAASQPRDGRQKLHAIKERQPKSGEPPQGSPTNYLVHRERARAEERRGSRSGARLGGPARRACRMLAGNMALRQRATRMPGDRGGASGATTSGSRSTSAPLATQMTAAMRRREAGGSASEFDSGIARCFMGGRPRPRRSSPRCFPTPCAQAAMSSDSRCLSGRRTRRSESV